MVDSIGNTISSLISRLGNSSRSQDQRADGASSQQQVSTQAIDLDSLDISDAARARLESDQAALELARDIPNQLRQSALEFDQVRLSEISNRLDVLGDIQGPAFEGLLEQTIDEVLSIARRTLSNTSNLGLSNPTQSLQEFL